MTKPKLLISNRGKKNPGRILGMSELLGFLEDSGKFDIGYHDDYVNVTKGDSATILYYNDKKIYLDLWEYSLPTYSSRAYNAEFDLIIKLQHKRLSMPLLRRVCRRKKILDHLSQDEIKAYTDKMVPWTFFPSRMMKQFIGKEDEIEQRPIEREGFFCGKCWKARGPMKRRLEKFGIEFVGSNQALRRGRPLTDSQYLNKMMTSKYGIVLHGRGSHFTEAKNRREIDYMILKKPMLLNYKPYYYNALENGKHYIYIDEKTEIDKLEEMYNIDEIAENAYQWYLKNATPEGAVNVFLQIMQDRFGE